MAMKDKIGGSVQAAGRELSEKNSRTLVSLVKTLSNLLKEAGVEFSLDNEEEEFEYDLMSEASITDHAKRAGWFSTLYSLLQEFRRSYIESLYPDGKDAESTLDADKLVSELSASLRDLSKNRVLDGDQEGAFSRHSAMHDSEPYMLSKRQETEIAVEARSLEIGQIVLAQHSNKHPFSGTLFQVDSISEEIPAVGVGLPLFVPREVAAQAIETVNNLPLDAHDSLDRHAGTEIVGTIESARLEGSDFVVSGYLWPFNQQSKVDSILAAQKKLGMSMNAKATGFVDTANGIDFFNITKLEILGANILYSKSATYQKTKIAASIPITKTEEDSMTEELKELILGLQSEVAQLKVKDQPSEMDALRTNVEKIKESVQVLLEEREAKLQLEKQREQEASEQESKDKLGNFIKEVVQESLAAGGVVQHRGGGRNRVSTSLTQQGIQAKGSNSGEAVLSQLQLQGIEIAAQLKELRSQKSLSNLSTRFQAADQLRQIKDQLIESGEGIPETVALALSAK